MVPDCYSGAAQANSARGMRERAKDTRPDQSSQSRHSSCFVCTSAALGNFQARAHRISPHAHRRSSTLPRQRRGPPYVAEAFGAHRAGAARRPESEPHPNENRLVALREALGRLSRRRRRVPRGRRERWAKRTPAFTLLLQQRGELSNVRNVVNQSEAVVACQLLQKKRCPGGQSTRAALTAAS